MYLWSFLINTFVVFSFLYLSVNSSIFSCLCCFVPSSKYSMRLVDFTLFLNFAPVSPVLLLWALKKSQRKVHHEKARRNFLLKLQPCFQFVPNFKALTCRFTTTDSPRKRELSWRMIWAILQNAYSFRAIFQGKVCGKPDVTKETISNI